MINVEMDDYSLVEELSLATAEVRLAIDEINENEDDIKQLLQIS